MSDSLKLHQALREIPEHDWNALSQGHVLLQHAFLAALEDTLCVGGNTGWLPRHLGLYRNGRLAAAMPLYIKLHSMGEFVFDHAWADAYHRHGLEYYPKLLCAVPFSPVTGPRLLAHTLHDKATLLRAAMAVCDEYGLSSLHILYPDAEDAALASETGLLMRHDVQFHWTNADHDGYDSFLASLSGPKRKKMRQESRRLADAGIRFEVLEGPALDNDALRFFYRCYRNTYLERGRQPYLNLAFFRQMNTQLPDAMVMIRALQNDEPVACALNFRSGGRLLGRYWGALRYVPGLHFETCYAQGIRYCLEHGLEAFEGGAQGEHKLARGLLPVRTTSAHWVRHSGFADAIADYLDRERQAVGEYTAELDRHSPYRRG